MAITLSTDKTSTGRKASLSLSEQERLDELDPLRHLLANDLDDDSNVHDTPEDFDPKSVVQLLPQQRHTIQDENYIVRYHADPKAKPETIFVEKGQPKATPTDQLEKSGSVSHYDVTLNCDQSRGCGGIIWPAAEVLGQYIASNKELKIRWQEKMKKNKHGDHFEILELGSGTGLVGLLVSRIGFGEGFRSWITDQEAMLEIMTKNLILNPSEDECRVAELNWGQPLPQDVPHKPDVLLLADCVYLEVAFQPLIDTMLELSTSETEILFCYQKRRKADKRFFILLKKYFTFNDVEDDDPERAKVYRREGTQLLRVFKK